jgi:septal ring factor EnvC (AmiA/AmiB activator)
MTDRPHPRFAAGALLLALWAAFAGVSGAEEADPAAEIVARQAARQAELDRISSEITLSKERVETLAGEIAEIRKDAASITAALIQAAKTERKLGEDIEDISARLEELKGRQQALRSSLSARRDVLAEVLGALERLGMNPPPALLVKPEDALSSVRSAILLGAVVPQLRGETERLLADLEELGRVAASIQEDRQQLMRTVEEQIVEQKRLGLLLDEKSRLEQEQQALLERERARTEELGKKARSLKDLIASIEKEVESTRSAAEKARRAEEERARREAALSQLPIPDANRLSGPTPFSKLTGQLQLPVAGRVVRRFGQDDGNGGVMHGDTVTTQSASIVTAPSDGEVLYAGPFRSYGQLLILNAGDGYHVVLAGMGRINVAPGQSVIAGEPVGAMGEAGESVSGSAMTTPELYIEFRKDGKPVDPAPWWSVQVSGRTANDT